MVYTNGPDRTTGGDLYYQCAFCLEVFPNSCKLDCLLLPRRYCESFSECTYLHQQQERQLNVELSRSFRHLQDRGMLPDVDHRRKREPVEKDFRNCGAGKYDHGQWKDDRLGQGDADVGVAAGICRDADLRVLLRCILEQGGVQEQIPGSASVSFGQSLGSVAGSRENVF